MPASKPANLSHGFARHVSSTPHQDAFVLGPARLSYAALAQQAARWRSHLENSHLANNQAQARECMPRLVAWCGANHPCLPALYLACVQSGYCLVMLDPAWPAATTCAICAHFQLDHVISPETAFDVASEHLSEDISHTRLPDATADAYFLLGFTSGSTGQPKAFIRRQHSWLETFSQAAIEFPGARRVLAPGPLSHGLSFYAMAETLHRGGSVHCLPAFDAEQVLEVLETNSIETLVVVPTMLQSIVTAAGNRVGVGQLQQVISAGAKLSPDTRRQVGRIWPGVAICEYYGASELSFVSVSQPQESAPADSVGRAFSGVDISIRDKTGSALAAGQAGEVYVRSGMLADGYLQPGGSIMPLDTTDGYASVGDIGKLDEHGFLFLLDRRDNMIISGGLNVYPAEVQQVLNACPGVEDSVVTCLPDHYWGEKVVAFLRISRGGSFSVSAFRQYCRETLSAQQIPRELLLVRSWPLTGSGKIAVPVLAQMAAEQLAGQDIGELARRHGMSRVGDE